MRHHLSFNYLLSACLLLGCAGAAGTSPQNIPARLETTQLISPDQQRGQQILADLMNQMSAESAQTDPRTLQHLDGQEWALATCCGYDFKSDQDGWQYWYDWLTRRDETVIPKCLKSDNWVTVELGIDIAFSTGKKENIQLVLEQFQSDEQFKGFFADVIADWSRGEGLQKHATSTEVGYDKILTSTDSFWAAVSERVAPLVNQ